MAEEYKVVRVVDGDTIDVRSGLLNTTTRVRLLNVDAPGDGGPRTVRLGVWVPRRRSA
jgi:endonuclease YncB( thermonuclease family)